jgi:hypothetical protein
MAPVREKTRGRDSLQFGSGITLTAGLDARAEAAQHPRQVAGLAPGAPQQPAHMAAQERRKPRKK